MTESSARVDSRAVSDWTFLRRALIALAVVVTAYLAWEIADLFMLFFAAVLLAVLLGGFAKSITNHSPLSPGWGLVVSCVSLAAMLGILLSVFGAQVAGQISGVFGQLPDAINAAGSNLGISDSYSRIREAVYSGANGKLLSRAANVGYTALGVVADLTLVVVVAIYLAAAPDLYRNGTIKLFPRAQHARIVEALDLSAAALRLWFLGQLVSMTLVGILSGFAFWVIGLPSPLGLGVIAGVTNFVPLIGPIVGSVPAVIFAATQDLHTVLWTGIAVLVIQQLEGNFITPLIQKRAVDVPPALILIGISTFGALAGVLGIILAAPLTVVLMVLVQKLWIRDALGTETAIPGERGSH